MTGQHTALIVEDEPEMAEEISDLVRSFGHASIHVETKADALARLDSNRFCYVLLDMQIKTDRDSIKAHVWAGMSLLEEIRSRFPVRTSTDMHQLPVLVVSGHAKEHDDVVRAFQAGADDFVRKPLSLGNQDIGSKIRNCLIRAGRTSHGDCESNGPDGAHGDAAEQAFWHELDYSEIHLHGNVYRFTGPIQLAVVRLLHQAALTPSPWLSGKAVLGDAGSTDSAQKMGNLFSGHPCWGVLIESNRRGKYRMRIE